MPNYNKNTSNFPNRISIHHLRNYIITVITTLKIAKITTNINNRCNNNNNNNNNNDDDEDNNNSYTDAHKLINYFLVQR